MTIAPVGQTVPRTYGGPIPPASLSSPPRGPTKHPQQRHRTGLLTVIPLRFGGATNINENPKQTTQGWSFYIRRHRAPAATTTTRQSMQNKIATYQQIDVKRISYGFRLFVVCCAVCWFLIVCSVVHCCGSHV